ncbi:uncharacterized protein LOC141631521 [Silene latifolia]|uniref:uncharacterized protein LOC141631521 n=1 Tax=Silene latifolia TaxID=37657 RepID=UPI003D76EA03
MSNTLKHLPSSALEDLSIPQLDVFQQEYISQPVTSNDVEKAFFSMKPNKSPGPDGFPPRFYQLYWDIIKDDITSAVLSFLNFGHLLPAWNNTHIVLIPKVDIPDHISQFRPISLCNVIYRAASKCIASRLRRVIDTIIGQNQNAFVSGRLISIKLSRHSPAISHLLYADDSLLCIRLTSNGCETLRSILNHFSSISGQMINYQKSYIKFSPNSPADFKEHITDILKVQTKSNFGQYLGVPIDLGRRKLSAFQFLVDKIASKILSWGPANFSQAAKLILVNSILMASVNYVASVLPIPLQITVKINYPIDLFWWKKSHNKRAQHWLPFEQLQLPKSDGGLGLKNARLVSQALLVKIFWRSQHHSTSLLSKITRSKYQKDFPIPHKISKYSAASFGWKGIVKSTFLLRDGIAWKFGNGRSIDLKNDAWVLGNKPFFKSQTQAQTISFDDLLLDSTHWSSKAVFKYFNTASAKSICAMELPSEPTDDYIYWKFTEDGSYSAKSGYSYLLKLAQHSSASRSHTSSLFGLIWKLPCQPHIKLFLWKIVNQILPTADVLIRRGMNVSPTCCFCHLDSESLSHLFRDCDIVKRLWLASILGIRIEPASNNIPFLTWVQKCFIYLFKSDIQGIWQAMRFSLTLFAIWKHRNNVIFRGCPVNPIAILQEADFLYSQQHVFASNTKSDVFASAKSNITRPSISSPEIFHHCFKINVAFNKKILTGSFHIRYNNRIDHEVSKDLRCSRLQSSITALLKAMVIASAGSLQNVLFIVENNQLLRLLDKDSVHKVPISVSNSLSRIKFYLSCNINWYVSGFV